MKKASVAARVALVAALAMSLFEAGCARWLAANAAHNGVGGRTLATGRMIAG